MYIYVVKSGDTVYKIARSYGVSPQRIITDNGLKPTGELVVGQALLILIPNVVYTARPGDTVESIAQAFGVTPIVIQQNNPLLVRNRQVYPGQTVVISYNTQKNRSIVTNGYCYTYIDREVLLNTLPYLTRLSIFSYGFAEDGSVINIDDEELIQLALRYRTVPIMVISSITEDGTFSGERANTLFYNIELQNRFIGNVIAVMREKGFLGLDVDFEYVNADDRNAYSSFVRNITQQLNAAGYTVNVDLAPKTSDAMRGTLYEGHDYSALGEAANTVLLMTYEWGYTYSEPMAVAPVDKVEQVIQYAVTEIPPQKIMMGIPNYGYDWRLPFVRGESRAQSVGNEQAVEIAYANRAQIEFDATAQSPNFTYWSYQDQHVVWFEDVRSIRAKLNLITQYNLLGAGYWNIMRDFTANWMLVSNMFNITKQL